MKIILQSVCGLWLHQKPLQIKKKTNKQTKRKELDADSKVIQQKEFVEQLKNLDDAIVANGSMFRF